MTPLDELLKKVIGPLDSASTKTELEKSTTESTSGELTSTVKITVTTIRAVRRRFTTNISDETIGALIEAAISETTPKIKDCTGEQLESLLIYYTECARVIQNTFHEHDRQAHAAKAPSQLSMLEIEELKRKRAAEKELRVQKEVKKGKIHAKQAARAVAGEKLPLWEKFTRATDPTLRNAGKFLKAQFGIVSEKAAVKTWNDLMSTANPAAMIKNAAGERWEIVMERKEGKSKK